jgi:hypothetical protein
VHLHPRSLQDGAATLGQQQQRSQSCAHGAPRVGEQRLGQHCPPAQDNVGSVDPGAHVLVGGNRTWTCSTADAIRPPLRAMVGHPQQASLPTPCQPQQGMPAWKRARTSS